MPDTNSSIPPYLSAQNELLNAASGQFLSDLQRSTNPSTTASTFDPFSQQLSSSTTSGSPISGSLNLNHASRNSSSYDNSNISPFDATSFNTDNHQRWLSSLASRQPLAQNSPNNNNSNDNDNDNALSEDFVLFPSAPLVPSLPPRLRDSRAAAAPPLSATALKRSTSLCNNNNSNNDLSFGRRHSYLALQRHLQQQFSSPSSGSSVPVPPLPSPSPRVSRLPSQHSVGYRPSPLSSPSPYSYRSSSSNSNNWEQSRLSSSLRPVRPPVPLFPGVVANSSRNLNRIQLQNQQRQQQQQQQDLDYLSIMSPNIRQDMDLFDLPNLPGDDIELFGDSSSLLSSKELQSSGTMFDGSVTGVPSGTISPKDLVREGSAPPSATLTDMSTPPFDSPGNFSQNTSPMFPLEPELASGYEEWDSLFPVNDGFSTPLDSNKVDLDAATILEQPKAPVPVPESPVSRNVKSPSRPRSPARGVTKQSPVSGVNGRQRKPLPAITFNADDPVAAKRARNTEAARKSRARKLERQEVMQEKISELEKLLEESQRREQYWKGLAESGS